MNTPEHSLITDAELIRAEYHALSLQDKKTFLSSLTLQAWNEFRYYTDCILRPDQRVPFGRWRYFIAQCGRGWGKTMLGAHFMARQVYAGNEGLAIVAPTYGDIEDYMIEAISAEFPNHQQPRYIGGSKAHFVCFNGIKIKCYSSDKEIRGSNLRYVWCDEFCAWCDRDEEKATKNFDVLDFALRKGKAQFIITTTPREGWKRMRQWEERFKAGDPKVQIIYGATNDNIFLSADAKEELYARFKNTRMEKQELLGELLMDTPGAYWTHTLLDRCRSPLPAKPVYRSAIPSNDVLMGRAPKPEPITNIYLLRIVIGFDPSLSKDGDECGIVVVAMYSNGKAYVLADHSGQYTPQEWAAKVSELYIDYKASAVVIETNAGGEPLEYALRAVNANMKLIKVHTHQGKTTRAEHTANLYTQGKVFHTSTFKLLEEQMCSFNPNYTKSPDRVDALGHALTELFWSAGSGSSTNSMTNLPSR